MYAAIRRVTATSAEEFTRRVYEDLVPHLKTLPGFAAFYLFRVSETELVSFTLFETQAQAEASNRAAVDWIRDRVSAMVVSGPNPTVGEMTIGMTARPGEFPGEQAA